MMGECKNCRFAEWDYETFYNTTEKQWFVCGCKKDSEQTDAGECADYEEEMPDE